MPVKINGSTSGSTTITAPATGTDETIELSTALAAKLSSASLFTTLAPSTAEVTTEQSTDSGVYTDLASAGASVTVTTGTKALVIISASFYNDTADKDCFISFAVSGATSVSAIDKWAIRAKGVSSIVQVGMSRAHLLTGLTAGSNTFTMKYRVSGNTGYFSNRQISVINMGS